MSRKCQRYNLTKIPTENLNCTRRTYPVLKMDPQIRNFRDFLQLYNRITELCFSNCVNNFFSREIASDEAACLDKCVHKFTRVNQRIMNVYVEVQTVINERRMAELEEAQAQTQQQPQTLDLPQTNESIPQTPDSGAVSSISSLETKSQPESLNSTG